MWGVLSEHMFLHMLRNSASLNRIVTCEHHAGLLLTNCSPAGSPLATPRHMSILFYAALAFEPSYDYCQYRQAWVAFSRAPPFQ